MTIVCIKYLRRFYPLNEIYVEGCKYLVGSVGIIIVGIFIHQFLLGVWLTTILTVIFSIIVYFGILYALNSKLMVEIRKSLKSKGKIK